METTIRQKVLDELEARQTLFLNEQEGALKIIFNKIANKNGVLDKAAFLGFCKKMQDLATIDITSGNNGDLQSYSL